MDKTLLKDIKEYLDRLAGFANVRSISPIEAAMQAEDYGTQTRYNSFNYVSSVKNLSTALTVYLGSEQVEKAAYTQKKRDIKKSAPQTIRAVHDYLKRAPMIRSEFTMGNGSDFTPGCTLYLSTYRKESIRLAHMIAETLHTGMAGKGTAGAGSP